MLRFAETKVFMPDIAEVFANVVTAPNLVMDLIIMIEFNLEWVA